MSVIPPPVGGEPGADGGEAALATSLPVAARPPLMGKFDLVCLDCGRAHQELALHCRGGCSSLLRSRYQERAFRPAPAGNLFKFRDWLPCQTEVETAIGPVVYRCEELARRLAVTRLYCAFNGYWPERGAGNPTGTFKDLEALPTLLCLRERGKRSLVLASAGNTGRAFAQAARLVDCTVFIVVPEQMLDRLWLPGGERPSSVRLIAVAGSDDYSLAIRLAEEIGRRFGIDTEGGARNVARRDGLGTVMLEAGRVLGRLPDHYFQAVGSGTGGIAAYEAALRLLGDEHFQGQPLPRMHFSQNAPFLPIYRAWQGGEDADRGAWQSHGGVDDEPLFASVLANRTPPYRMRGGVGEVLTATAGRVYAVASAAAAAAARQFQRSEGVDLEPAAAVAVVSLQQAVAGGRVRPDEWILLNLTGGGLDFIRRDFALCSLTPDLVVTESSLDSFAALL